MTTIKGYTNIEQSRKLAEILPLESADMHYNNASIKGINYVDEYRAELMNYNRAIKVLSKYIINHLFEVIPCWSLAALLDILHSKVKNILSLSGGSYKDIEYISDWCLDYEFGDEDYQTFADNPIDACVAMIEKLHELKLL